MSVCVHVCVCVCRFDRVADKKAAIGYMYEDGTTGAGGPRLDSIDDDDASSDEDIDLGEAFTGCFFSLSTTDSITSLSISRHLYGEFVEIRRVCKYVNSQISCRGSKSKQPVVDQLLPSELLLLMLVTYFMNEIVDQQVCYSVVTVARICNSVGGGVFLDIPPRWRISVRVKARVVNWKQVDVAVRLYLNALIAHCTQRWRVH